MVYLSACEVGMPAWKSRSVTPREPSFVVSKAATQGRDWRIGNKKDVSLVLWVQGCNRADPSRVWACRASKALPELGSSGSYPGSARARGSPNTTELSKNT